MASEAAEQAQFGNVKEVIGVQKAPTAVSFPRRLKISHRLSESRSINGPDKADGV